VEHAVSATCLKGLRDRALLLLGFAGAFRRSELVALDVADLEEFEDGFKVTNRRSKTDQEGHGATIAIARGVTTCPVKAVKAWLQAAGISEGPLFRPVAKGGRLGTERLTDENVCTVVKAHAERIKLKGADFGAHSLRAGFLTSAARPVLRCSRCGTCRGTRAWTCCRRTCATRTCSGIMQERDCCR